MQMIDPRLFLLGFFISGCIASYLFFISPNKNKYLDYAEKLLGFKKWRPINGPFYIL